MDQKRDDRAPPQTRVKGVGRHSNKQQVDGVQDGTGLPTSNYSSVSVDCDAQAVLRTGIYVVGRHSNKTRAKPLYGKRRRTMPSQHFSCNTASWCLIVNRKIKSGLVCQIIMLMILKKSLSSDYHFVHSFKLVIYRKHV